MHYYTEDGKIFDSKIRAVDYGNKTGLKVFFYYHDDVYSKVDWKTEPPQSLDFYYKEQAQRIRDKYDYVILCYSGGYDSTNILETFHFNNIKLDKIVTVGALKQDSQSGVDENHNGELYHNVFPYLKELGLESITQVCDYTDHFNTYNNFSISQYGSEWVDYTGGWFSPHNWFWRDIDKHIIPKEWKDKKVALIFGKDKPGLFHSQSYPSEFGFCFRDTPCNSYGNLTGTDTCDRINFYWDKDYPEILVKQLHILNRVYMVNKTIGYDFDECVPKFGDYTVNKLIYNLRKPILFKSKKSPSLLLSLRDSFLAEKTNTEIHSLYSAGINRVKNVAGAEKAIQSKMYLI